MLDLALDGVGPIEATQLREELGECRACQEEYATLRNTLRVSAQALRSALPTEDFWPGHHARLHARLMSELSPVRPVRLSLSARLWNVVCKTATTSVRVPVPVGLAIIVLVGSFFFVGRSRGQASVSPSAPVASVETRTIQVPVIQEKVVTKVVYVEKKDTRSRGTANQVDRNAANSIASGWATTGKAAMSLVGFKPTDQLKLTIIKRDRDEK
jgi:hypothetical protein